MHLLLSLIHTKSGDRRGCEFFVMRGHFIPCRFVEVKQAVRAKVRSARFPKPLRELGIMVPGSSENMSDHALD